MYDAVRERIRDNLASVKARIEAACARGNRPTQSVQLVAVTKYAEMSWVRNLIELGQLDLGENRPQQLAERSHKIDRPVEWHLIGSLQRNKVRSTLPIVRWIHSIDSVRLLEAISRIAGELGKCPSVLLEVNVSGEESKHGFRCEELSAAWNDLITMPNVNVAGLMTMAPLSDDAETSRPVFRKLRELRDELRSRSPREIADRFQHLSMGMTGDFETAIEEGATFVRIGSALWEGLTAVSYPEPGDH